MKMIKKMIACFMVLSMLAGCSSKKDTAAEENNAEASTETAETTAAETEETENIVGGWTLNEDVKEAEIDSSILEAFDSVKTSYSGGELQALAVLGTQVVSGTNYAILAKEDKAGYAVAVLYADLSGNVELRQVTPLDISAKSYGELEDGNLDGGWSSSQLTAVDPETEYVEILNKAQEAFVGSELTYIMCLGTQLVSGTNYCFLCESKLVTAEPTTSPKLVYVYKDLDGNCSITDIADLSLAYFNE